MTIKSCKVEIAKNNLVGRAFKVIDIDETSYVYGRFGARFMLVNSDLVLDTEDKMEDLIREVW